MRDVNSKEQRAGVVWFLGASVFATALVVGIYNIDMYLQTNGKRERVGQMLKTVRMAQSNLEPAGSVDSRLFATRTLNTMNDGGIVPAAVYGAESGHGHHAGDHHNEGHHATGAHHDTGAHHEAGSHHEEGHGGKHGDAHHGEVAGHDSHAAESGHHEAVKQMAETDAHSMTGAVEAVKSKAAETSSAVATAVPTPMARVEASEEVADLSETVTEVTEEVEAAAAAVTDAAEESAEVVGEAADAVTEKAEAVVESATTEVEEVAAAAEQAVEKATEKATEEAAGQAAPEVNK